MRHRTVIIRQGLHYYAIYANLAFQQSPLFKFQCQVLTCISTTDTPLEPTTSWIMHIPTCLYSLLSGLRNRKSIIIEGTSYCCSSIDLLLRQCRLFDIGRWSEKMQSSSAEADKNRKWRPQASRTCLVICVYDKPVMTKCCWSLSEWAVGKSTEELLIITVVKTGPLFSDSLSQLLLRKDIPMLHNVTTALQRSFPIIWIYQMDPIRLITWCILTWILIYGQTTLLKLVLSPC